MRTRGAAAVGAHVNRHLNMQIHLAESGVGVHCVQHALREGEGVDERTVDGGWARALGEAFE